MNTAANTLVRCCVNHVAIRRSESRVSGVSPSVLNAVRNSTPATRPTSGCRRDLLGVGLASSAVDITDRTPSGSTLRRVLLLGSVGA